MLLSPTRNNFKRTIRIIDKHPNVSVWDVLFVAGDEGLFRVGDVFSLDETDLSAWRLFTDANKIWKDLNEG
jgi:hypothetical protein